MIAGVADDGLEIFRQYLWGSPSAFSSDDRDATASHHHSSI
jgi:hypothetical protein